MANLRKVEFLSLQRLKRSASAFGFELVDRNLDTSSSSSGAVNGDV
jgi:hypothetical protein